MPRKAAKKQVIKPDPEPEVDDVEQEEENQEEENTGMEYGVSEENDADDDNEGENQNENEEEGDGNENEAEAEEEQEQAEIAALEPDLVKEDQYAEIAEFFMGCKAGSLQDAKTSVRKVLDVLLKIGRAERAASTPASTAVKRKREDEDGTEKKVKTEFDDDEYPTFGHLPDDSFMDDDEETNDHKLNLVVLIPNEAALVGHIIGRGGATVKETKNRSGADIRVESDKFLAPGTPDRRIAVRGTVKTICFAVEYIVQLLKDKLEGGASQGGKDTLKFVIPDQAAGRAIGQKWAHMREMEQETGTRLQVLGKTQLPSLVTGRVIQAQGSFEGVCHAFYLCAKTVIEKVDYPDVWQTGDPTKDPSGRRDPPGDRRGGGEGTRGGMDERDGRNPNRAYDRDSRFGAPPVQPPPFGGPPVDPMIGGARLGPYGPTGGGAPGFGRGGFSDFGGGMGGGGAAGYGGGPSAGASAIKETQTTTEIEIPEQSVGFVFGRKGCQIREIRQRSGAGIDSQKRDGSSNHRVLSVSGSLSAVKMAVDMVNDLVLEWGRRERENPRNFGR